MKTFLIIMYLINIIFGIILSIKSKNENERRAWICSSLGWTCALINEI
jgi:hypothetical protein